jgi:hypothetical protein
MGLEQNNAQQYREIPTKNFVAPITTYQMTPYDFVLRPNSSAGAFTITLPPVAEARGRWYSILVRTAGNNITVADKDDSECWPGDITLDTKCDRLLLFSDGLTWLSFLGTLNSPS